MRDEANLAVVILSSIPDSLGSDLPLWCTLPLNAASLAIPTFVLLRFGLLAGISTIYVVNELAVNFPVAPAAGGWSGGPALFFLLVLGGLAAACLRTAVSGRTRP